MGAVSKFVKRSVTILCSLFLILQANPFLGAIDSERRLKFSITLIAVIAAILILGTITRRLLKGKPYALAAARGLQWVISFTISWHSSPVGETIEDTMIQTRWFDAFVIISFLFSFLAMWDLCIWLVDRSTDQAIDKFEKNNRQSGQK